MESFFRIDHLETLAAQGLQGFLRTGYALKPNASGSVRPERDFCAQTTGMDTPSPKLMELINRDYPKRHHCM